MNYWIISTIALLAVLITVLVMDSKHMHKLHVMVSASKSDLFFWKQECERLKLEIKVMEQRDAKQVAHLVLIRDEQIEHMTRVMKETETRHAKELAQREKTIFSLEKIINEKWPKTEGKE